MNHYDDRISYFALLVDTVQHLTAQDTNNQADISMSAYGGQENKIKVIDFSCDL